MPANSFSTDAFNAAAVSFGPKNEPEKKLLDALADGRASRGLMFGCMMTGASLSATCDKPGFEGWTPLMFAMKSRDNEALEFLLHQGADPDCRNAEGDTALMVIIKDRRKTGEGFDNDDFYMSRKLIRAYEDDPLSHINLQNRQGMTALMLAAEAGQWDFMTRILEAGADPFIKGPEDKIALDFARDAADKGFRAADARALLEQRAAAKKAQEDHIDAGLPTLAPVTVNKPMVFKK